MIRSPQSVVLRLHMESEDVQKSDEINLCNLGLTATIADSNIDYGPLDIPMQRLASGFIIQTRLCVVENARLCDGCSKIVRTAQRATETQE
jgi:hypothetical protein